MARLNEAPAPIENIDIVKRRFIRQNRELAKSNSTQSVRIRNLEIENGRLLAENLALREEALALQNELENYQHMPSTDTISRFKAELESKLYELGGIINGLSAPPKPKRRSSQTAFKKSPEERVWRNPLLVGDELSAQLPTIREDKQYPRQTLEPIEVTPMIVDGTPESPRPQLPTPSRSTDRDMRATNDEGRAAESLTSSKKHSEFDDSAPIFSANLETRRKRRDSHSVTDVSQHYSEELAGDKQASAKTTERKSDAAPSRAGTKRKLAVREDDDPSSKQDSDFSFSRRSAPKISISRTRTTGTQPPAEENAERRVLSNKTTNLSPKKVSRVASTEKIKPDRPSHRQMGKPRATETTKPDAISIPPPSATVRPDTVSLKSDAMNFQPETPAAFDDLMSPLSIDASTGKPVTKDTPPPTNILGEDSNNGRPSRRSRPRINYAEPDLVSKMRRPTKQMTDAVSRDNRRSINTTIDDSCSNPALTGDSDLRSAVIKMERDGEQDAKWRQSKAEPASPLGQKTGSGDNIDTESILKEVKTKDIKGAGSSAVISALISGSKKKTHGADVELARNISAPEVDPMAVFECISSSPDRSHAGDVKDRNRNALSKSRVSRRHSSISALSAGTGTKDSGPLRRDATRDRIRKPGSDALEKRRVHYENDVQRIVDKSVSDVIGDRKEAVARRRRSMML